MPCFLAIDFGERRTGVALGDTESGRVTPLATVQRSSDQQLVDQLGRLAAEHRAAEFVLGLPCRLNGSEGDAAFRVRSFARKLSTRCRLQTSLVSETLTSRAARERIAAAISGTASQLSKNPPRRKLSRPKKDRNRRLSPEHQVDAVAAQIIGEQFLSRPLVQRTDHEPESGAR